MYFRAKPSRRRLPPIIAVAASMLVPVAGIIVALACREMVILPGALVSLVFYGLVGYFAIEGHEWARWLIFAFLLMTALVGLGFTFVSLGTGKPVVEFNLWIALVGLFYLGAAVLMALPANPPAVSPTRSDR